MWGPSRHLGSFTAANWVSFDLNSCWGYSSINTLKLKGRGTFGLSVNCPCASNPSTAHSVANSRFFCLFHPLGEGTWLSQITWWMVMTKKLRGHSGEKSRNSCYTLSNGAIPKLNFLVSGRISVVMSTFSVFGLSYGRSDNEFCAEEGQNPIFDPLPRNEKLCGNL